MHIKKNLGKKKVVKSLDTPPYFVILVTRWATTITRHPLNSNSKGFGTGNGNICWSMGSCAFYKKKGKKLVKIGVHSPSVKYSELVLNF